jgi:hypothetical protein
MQHIDRRPGRCVHNCVYARTKAGGRRTHQTRRADPTLVIVRRLLDGAITASSWPRLSPRPIERRSRILRRAPRTQVTIYVSWRAPWSSCSTCLGPRWAAGRDSVATARSDGSARDCAAPMHDAMIQILDDAQHVASWPIRVTDTSDVSACEHAVCASCGPGYSRRNYASCAAESSNIGGVPKARGRGRPMRPGLLGVERRGGGQEREGLERDAQGLVV